jgi:hypothetical protein
MEEGRWKVDALGAPHIGERSEKALIASDSPAPTALCIRIASSSSERGARTLGTR